MRPFGFGFLAFLISAALMAGEAAPPETAPKPPAPAAAAADDDDGPGKTAEEYAAGVAKAVEGAEKLTADELLERIDTLVQLGKGAAEEIRKALPGAGERGKLILAKVLVETKVKEHQDDAVGALLDLAGKSESAEIRILAANTLGQSRILWGAGTVTAALDKLAENEKDRRALVALHRARGRLGAGPEAADSLLIIMKNSTGRLRKEAALAIGEIGQGSIPEVRRVIAAVALYDPTELSDRALSIYRSNLARDPLFAEVLELVSDYSDAEKDKRDRDKLVRAALHGMVASLDPFSEYMEPDDAKQLTEHLAGEYGGIGAYVNLVDGVFTIISPIYDGPAHKAGLRSMDRILEVDGIKTTDEPMNKTISRLKGAPGTDVKVKVFRRGWREPQEMTVKRDKISVQSVFQEMLPGSIGYVRLSRFGPKTGEEMAKALGELRDAGMKGLVLDLRDNPGGYLQAAVSASEEFLAADQPIVSSRGRRVKTQNYKATGGGGTKDVPMVVLVNSGAASASEILAGALRDNNRAALVGKKTYGKGSVQQPINLKSQPGAILKLTIAKYYLPGGECIHEKGIAPNVEVASEEEITAGWKYEEVAKVLVRLEEYAVATYKQDPEGMKKLADDDGGDPANYPGLAEKLKELKCHLEPEDVRPFVRRELRRLASDDRAKRYVANIEDDRQLRKAALVCLERMKVAAADLPAPYARYATKFAAEDKDRESQAAAKAGLPEGLK
jgi:carboxyl-terminal processing protease